MYAVRIFLEILWVILALFKPSWVLGDKKQALLNVTNLLIGVLWGHISEYRSLGVKCPL